MGKRETDEFCGCSRKAKSQGSAVSGTFFLAFVVLFVYLGYAASFDGFRVSVLNETNVLGEPVVIDVTGPNSTNFTMNVYWNQSLVLSQNAVTDAFGMFSSRPNFSVPGRYTANISEDNVSPSVASALFYVVFPNVSGNGSLFFIQPMRETVSNWSADNASGLNASVDVNMSGGAVQNMSVVPDCNGSGCGNFSSGFFSENGSLPDFVLNVSSNVSLGEGVSGVLNTSGAGIADNLTNLTMNMTTHVVNVTGHANETDEVSLSLVALKSHFGLDERPSFDFECVPGKSSSGGLGVMGVSFVSGQERGFGKLATDSEVVRASVYYSGEFKDIDVEILKKGDGRFGIEVLKPRGVRAGAYTLRVEMAKDGEMYVQEREFLWGLVSLNTKKSIYRVGESAEFLIVVLDRSGHPVCGADVSLRVTDPAGRSVEYSTGDGSVSVGPECGIYNAGHLTKVEGVHVVDVSAVVWDDLVFFSTYFAVQDSFEFDIVRVAQSKIDPTMQDWFDVRIDIESFTGGDSVVVKEFVPTVFDVVTDAQSIMFEDDTKTITWNRDLTGNKTFVSYSYSVPHVWPYLYALGPCEIAYDGGVFKEARAWYVAVDPTITIVRQNCTSCECLENGGAASPACTCTELNTSDGSYASSGLDFSTRDTVAQSLSYHDETTIPGAATVNDADVCIEWYYVCSRPSTCSIEVWDGSTWNVLSTTCYSTEDLYCYDAASYIDTPTKASNSRVKVNSMYTSSSATCTLYVDRVYVDINYTLSDSTPPIIENETLNTTEINRYLAVRLNASTSDPESDVTSAKFTVKYPNGTSVNFTASEVSANYWEYNFSDTSKRGEYNWTCTYATSEAGTNSSTTGLTFDVYDATSINLVLFNSSNPIRGTAVSILARLINSTSDGVEGQNITFKDGAAVIGHGITNSTGWAEFNWSIASDETVGAHAINATYAGNASEYYRAGYNDTESVTVWAATSVPLVVLNNSNPPVGDVVRIDAKLVYGNATAIEGQNISFYYDSTLIGSDATNSTGWAVIDWDTTGVSGGTYTINATYAGNSSLYTEAEHNDTEQATVAGPPAVDAPLTYNNVTLAGKTAFARSNGMTVRVNVTDDEGAASISAVVIEILNTIGDCEVCNETMANITGITDGYTYEYNWTIPSDAEYGAWTINVYANDTLGADSSNTGGFSVADIYMPFVTLIVPVDDSERTSKKNVTFVFNVSAEYDISNCSLIINGSINKTDASIEKNTNQSIYSSLDDAFYSWSINCTDVYGRQNSSEARVVNVNVSAPGYSKFNGNTTNFAQEKDIKKVNNCTLEIVESGKIVWKDEVNARSQNFDRDVAISHNLISVDSSKMHDSFNSTATLSLYNVTYSFTPIILMDSGVCPGSVCSVDSYDAGAGVLVFNVTHFTSYASSANSNLTIWDDTDAKGGGHAKQTSEQVRFFANYTNHTSGESVNGSGVYCNISFNVGGWSAPENMTFNSSTLLYEYNRSFSSDGIYDWNVTCNGSVSGYEAVNTTDDVTISEVITRLILFWDGASSAPTGWTCISCNDGDPFYEKFPRGAAAYGGTGGASSHVHTVSWVSSTGPSGTESHETGATQVGTDAHTHDSLSSSSTSDVSILPRYRNLKVISCDAGTPTTIPAGAIAMFNATPPSGWSAYSAQNAYFARGGGTIATGGQNNHTHTASITTGGPSATIGWDDGGGDPAGDSSHTHSATDAGPTSLSDHRPPYIEVIFAKADSDILMTPGIIGMFNESLSSHWIIMSEAGQDFNEKFIVGNSSNYGDTGGSATHTHDNLDIVTGTPSSTAGGRSSGVSAGSETHTHTITVSFNDSSNLPPYRDAVFAYFTNDAPEAEEPKTYNSSLTELSNFEVGEDVTIRVDVADADGVSDMDAVLITITNPGSTVKVDNATMSSIANVTNGYTYEYNYTAMPADTTSVGTWDIDIYVNDSYSSSGSNSTTFEGIIPRINVTANESAYNSSETVNASGTFFYDNGNPIAGRNVTVEFINTTGDVVQASNITTDSDGYYSDTWNIPYFSASGTYTVNVTASTDLNTAINTTTFSVYGATYGSTIHTPPTHTSSSITQTAGDQFDLTVTFENYGPDTAKSVNISLVNSSGITLNSTFEECGNVASGSNCVESFEVTLATATTPGTYWVNSTTNWINNNTVTNSTNATTEITVDSNPVLDVTETEVTGTVNHSDSLLVGNFTVNSTGNDALNSINYYAVGGTLPQDWLAFDPASIASLAAGNTQNVNVTVSVPVGQAPALYWTNLTVNSTEGKEDWLWLNITVSADDSWTRTPAECEKNLGLNQTGTLCTITVNNTGNVLLDFNVTPDALTNYTEPDDADFTVSAQETNTFKILYNSTDADTGDYTVTYNISGDGTPSYLLVDVNLTIYNYTLTINITSPTQSSPTENRTAGETLQIRAEVHFNNGTDEWEEKENVVWVSVYLDATECPIANSAFDPVADDWEVNCTLPDITDGVWYDLTLEGEKTPENITGQGAETSAVHYKDVSAPTISDVSMSPSIQDLNRNVTIAANVTDNVLVDEVWAEITGAATVNLSMSVLTGSRYYVNYTVLTNGTYHVRIYANDTPFGNLDNTSLYEFAVYNTTNGSLEQTPSVDVSDITQTDSNSFEITLTFYNTGNATAYSANITIEKPAGWSANSTFEQCGDVARDASCTRSFNITVPAGTASGTYYVNGTAEWRNPDDTVGNATNQTTVNVLSNPALDVPETSITDTINHGIEKTLGSFTVNSTGNDALSTVQFDCVSGNMSPSWVEYIPASISSLAAGATQAVNVNVTVPAGQAQGDYYCRINVTSSNDGSDWLWLNITVPYDDSWTRTPVSCPRAVQANKTRSVCSVTVQNTGNVPLNFSIVPATLTNYTEPSKTSFTIAVQGSDSFNINYNTTDAIVGETNITTYNVSSNSTTTPYQTITVTLTIIEIEWWNSSWLYRRHVDVTEPGISQRVNWPVNVFIDTNGNADNCTKEFRAADDDNIIIPYTVYNETYSGEKCQSANIVFLVNETQSETRAYFIYYGNPSASKQTYSIWQDSCGTSGDSTTCATIYYSKRSLSSGLDTWNTTTPLGMGNEDYKTRSLPWTFKYFNQSFSSVYVLDNGFLDFASTTADSTPSQAEFAARDMIAALWDDYDTSGTAYPIVNGDFESGSGTDAYNWAESGTASVDWQSINGNPLGNIYMYILGSSLDRTGYADQDFTYSWEFPPNKVTLDFDWYRAIGGTGDADLYVQIKNSTGSFETVWSDVGASTGWNVVSGVDITSKFTSADTYTIRLYAHLVTESSGSSYARARWDDVSIKVNYSIFDVYENQQSSPSRMVWTWDTETDVNLYNATYQSVLYNTGDIMLRYGPVQGYDEIGHLAGISNGDSLNSLNNLHGNNENTAFFQFSDAATTNVQPEDKLVIPNITSIAVYDVTGLEDTHTGGTVVKSDLNATFDMPVDEDGDALYRVEVNVTGNASWSISVNTKVYHEGLDTSWQVNETADIWYDIGTLNFTGGTWSGGEVAWSTSLGGSVPKDEIISFCYVVNVSGPSKLKQVHFFVNETNWEKANGLSWNEDYSTYNVTDAFAPYYSNAEANNTNPKWGEDVKFSALWFDNIALDSYIFSWNCTTGDTWQNDSSMDFAQASNSWSNITKSIPDKQTYTCGWRIYANDTSGNWNVTNIQTFTIQDSTYPWYSLNQTNSTEAGEDVLFSLYWEDNIALAGYIFSFDNGVGTFTNDSYVEMTGTDDWSNVTKTILSEYDATVRWRVYANDSAGNMNISGSYSFQTTDTVYPYYSLNQTNSTEAGADVLFSLYWEDNIALAGYIFSFDNGTGTFENDSYVEMTGTGNWSNVTKDVNSTIGSTVRWRIYANDSAGNMNVSLVYGFDTVDTRYPLYSLNQTNSTEAGTDVLFSLYWEDNIALAGHIFSFDNGVGSFTNDSYVDMMGVGNWSNVTKSVNSTIGTTVRWRVYANDSAGNMNISGVYSFETIDTGYPQYSNNQTNSTEAGEDVLFSLYWEDNIALAGYIFSFDNGVGSFTNDSYVDMTGTGNWSNVTKTIISEYDAIVRWRVYANDSVGNMNISGIYTFQTTDTTYPTYSQNQTNSTEAGENVLFSLYWEDNVALAGYIFSFDNGTGTFTNDSYVEMTGTGNWSNVTKDVNSTIGSTVRWRVYANDSAGNMNVSLVYGFDTVDTRYPLYSLNQTNSTEAGTDVLFSLYWEDNIALAGYIFSFDNGVGSFTNDSYVEMMGVGNWSNVTKSVNSTIGTTVRWRVYANDSAGNMNISGVYSFETIDTGYPQYSNNQTNSTEAGEDVLFSLYWEDNIALAGYIFSFDNGVGSFTNDSYVEMSGVGNWSNGTKTIVSEYDATVRWRVYANDSAGNMNVSAVYSFQTTDSEYPRYLDNQTNSTEAGEDVLFSLYWSDNIALVGYIFSFDNGTGTFTNDSYVEMMGKGSWSNVTKSVNSTIGATVRWRVYANDSAGNMNVSLVYGFDTVDTRYPLYSLNQTNSTEAGEDVLFSLYWSDNIALSGYIFSFDNGVGSFTNDSYVDMTGVGNWSNVTKTIISEYDATVRWRVYANDSAGNMNVSGIYSFQTTDSEYPRYSDNQTNSTEAGEDVLFSLYWEDNIALVGYIFSFDNGVGSFTNDSYVEMSGVGNWSNVTKTIISEYDATVRWRVYANDSAGNMNVSGIYSFQTTDSAYPRYSDNQTNSTEAGEDVLFSLYWEDNVALAGYVFSFDNGVGSFTNDSYVEMMGVGNWSNVTKSVNSTIGATVRWRVYANDSAGNMNVSGIYSFQSTDSAYPTYSDNQTNSTEAGEDALFSLYWEDNIALVGYIFSFDNGVGSFTNDSYVEMTGVGNWSNVTKTIISEYDVTVRWRVYANDSAGNMNVSGIYSFQSTDSVYPTYSDNQTNSTEAGEDALFSLYWEDNILLAGYIFSFDNGVGSFTNDSYVEMIGVGNWSNVTKTILSEYDATVRWRVYANDSAGNMNVSAIYSFQTTDSEYPRYSDNQTNSTEAGEDVLFSLYWEDNIALAGYVFSFDNGTGTFTNDSYVDMIGVGNWSNVTKSVNSTIGATVRWRVYANDSAGNMNVSLVYGFDTVDTRDPMYSLNQTNSTEAGEDVLFSLYWEDNIALAGYIFSFDNGVGSFTNDSYVGMIGVGNWSNVTKTIISEYDATVRWRVYANDSAGNMNVSDIFSFQTTDSVYPKYSNNQTNSTEAGEDVLFSLYWSDNIALSGYIFSFDNGVGSFTNDSYVDMTGVGNWSNVTKSVVSEYDATVRWRVYANDSAGNMNVSVIFSFQTTDSVYPTYSLNQTNSTEAGEDVLFSLYWEDNVALAGYIFSFDNGVGSFTNDSYVEMSGVGNWSNVTKTIVSVYDETVRWRVYANDSAGNMNVSGIYSFQTTDSEYPQYSLNQTNSTEAGEDALFSLYWEDNIALAGYIFSFDNGVGSFTNDSYVEMTGTGNWSNVTETILSEYDAIVRWRVYANDSAGNMNVSAIYSFQTTDSEYPRYSDNQTNSTEAGEDVLFSLYWEDNIALAGYIFSFDNGVGSFTNDSYVEMIGVGNWSNVTKTILSEYDATVRWRVYASDSAGNMNVSEVYIFQTTDSEYPRYSDNQTNSTEAGEDVLFSLYWEDNIALSGYIFSFDNGTGTFTNDSYVDMIGIGNWSNVTKSVNSTIGATVRWRVYANDSAGNMNVSLVYGFDTVDTRYPKYSLNQTNSTEAGEDVLFSLYWSDNIALAGYIFSFDNGVGSFTNDSYVDMTGTGNWSNVTKTIISEYDATVRWRVYANDSAGNLNVSAIYSFQTTDSEYPRYSDNQTNSTEAGEDVLFSLYWSDNIALAGYIFSFDNGVGSFTNDSYVDMTGVGNWSNVTKSVISEYDATVRWRVYANDSAGNMNVSEVYIFQTTDSEYPRYSDNQTNSTEAGEDVLFSLYWEDNVALSGYIFSFDNGVGSFTNDSYVDMTGVGNWSNVTKTVVSEYDATVHWRVYANDSAGNMNVSEIFSFQTTDSEYPRYSDNQTNSTEAGEDVLFSLYWEDNIALAGYIFSFDNGVGSFTNDSYVEMIGVGNWSNVTKTILSEYDTTVQWRVYANDSAGNMNVSEIFTFQTTDSEYPRYSDNQTNSTEAGEDVLFSLYWEDNIALSGYIFSFDNGVGSFTNDSYVDMTGVGNWSNVTKTIISEYDATVRWRVYANDSAGNMNVSGIYSFQTTDSEYPKYSLNQTNSTEAGEDVLFSLYWSDNVALAGYVFSFDNGTGTFTNDSYVDMIGVGNWSNVTKSVNSTIGATVRWRVYANDSAGNMNVSLVYSFDTVDTRYPKYSLNQTNSTEAGEDALFSLYWSDNIALAGYIFSFDNGVGSFTNDSYVDMIGVGNWSNVTKTIISEYDTTVRWRVYANDSAGNMNVSAIYSFQTTDSEYPKYSLNQTNSTEAGEDVLFSLYWEDNIALVGYIFSFDNGVGSFTNDSYVDMTGVGNWSNVTKMIISEYDATVRWRVYANDSAGNMNVSGIYSFQTTDSEYPKYSLNQTNSTEAGEDVLFSLYWTDNVALVGYVFSFDNGTGTFTNDSYVDMIGIGNWSNVTKSVNSTIGATVRWRVYANDSAGNMNVSLVYSFDTVDTRYPKYSLNQTNSTEAGEDVLFSLYWEDNIALAGYIFSFDNGVGSFTNDSYVDMIGAGNWSNVTKTILSEYDATVRWRVYANDSAGNMNVSAIYTFQTTDSEYPRYSDNQTNSTEAGEDVLFSLYWSDNIALAGYIFSFDNGVGSFTNDSYVDMIGVGNWSNVTKTIISEYDTTVRWRVYANDSAGNMNVSAIYTFQTTDSEYPRYSDNQTNSTEAGEDVLFSLYWSDNIALAGYIFSFDNGVGSFTNDSYVAMIGVGNWSNVTKTILSEYDVTVRWRVYANDSAGNMNVSEIYSFQTTDSEYPKYSLNQTNSTEAGEDVLFSLYWEDNIALAGYIFSFDNGVGSFTNDSYVAMIGVGNWSNVTKTSLSEYDAIVRWRVYANDSAGNMNVSGIYSFQTTDSAYPTYSDNQTNSTEAGEDALFSLYWEDNILLAGYIFSFDNGTGTFENDSYVEMTGTGNWSNVTKNINATYDVTVKWRVYANDSAGNMNVSDIFSFQATDTVYPVYSLNQTNSTIAGEDVLFSLYWEDNIALAGYIFSFDNGAGSFTNDSYVEMSGVGDWSNVTKSVNSTVGTTIQWIVYANDSAGNMNVSLVYGFETISSAVVHPNVTSISIYDVTGLSDTHVGGTLVGRGLNTTFALFADYDFHSRGVHRVEINVTGNSTWVISENTVAWLDNLNASWPVDAVNDIWYTNGTDDFTGGAFVSGNVSWDTSLGGMVAEDANVTFAFVVNLTGYTQDWQVHFFVNETDEGQASEGPFGDEDYSVYNLTQVGYLEVALVVPPDNTTVPWHRNFTVNSTVYCRSGDCWDVYGYARYNASSLLPDASVSTTQGAVPFYVNDGNGNPQTCGSMLVDEYCSLSWVVNSTGTIGSYHEVGVLFNSTLNQSNSTLNSTVNIRKILLMSLGFSVVDFGTQDPLASNIPAVGNPGNLYNVSLDVNSNDADGGLWIKGENLTKVSSSYEIEVSAVKWNASSHASKEDLAYGYGQVQAVMISGANTTMYYWVNVPSGKEWGEYEGTMWLMVNATDV